MFGIKFSLCRDLRANICCLLFQMQDCTWGLHTVPNLVTRMNSKKIDGKEKISKRLKIFYDLIHAVKRTVTSTLMIIVAHDNICLFFFSEFCKIQFPNSVGLLNIFIVISTFRLTFPSALGIVSRCLVNSMIDNYTQLFFKIAS